MNKERENLTEENKRLKAKVIEYRDEIGRLKELLVNSKAEITILKSEVKDYKTSEMAALSNYHKYNALIKELEGHPQNRNRSVDNKSGISARESNDQPELSAYINYDNRTKSMKVESSRPLAKQGYFNLANSKNHSIQNSRLVVC